MKFKGKAISGSSILSMLGVVCFATILVAAAVVTLGTATIDQKTVVDTGTSVSTQAFTDSADPDYLAMPSPLKNTAYDFATKFTATGPDPAGWYEVTVSGTGVTSLSSVVLKYWDGTTWSAAVVGTYGTNDIVFIVDNNGWAAAGDVIQGFQITLTNAGDFAVSVDVNTGTA